MYIEISENVNNFNEVGENFFIKEPLLTSASEKLFDVQFLISLI